MNEDLLDKIVIIERTSGNNALAAHIPNSKL
jgi:hypothetical protein